MRVVAFAALVGAAASGCIIYAEPAPGLPEPCVGLCDDDRTTPPGTDETTVEMELFLSVSEAVVGESVRTTLESRSRRGFVGYRSIRFQRDVSVADQVLLDDEVALVLSVAETAVPGPVDAVVDIDGELWALERPFLILDASATTPAPGDTGAPQDTAGDTGSTGP